MTPHSRLSIAHFIILAFPAVIHSGANLPGALEDTLTPPVSPPPRPGSLRERCGLLQRARGPPNVSDTPSRVPTISFSGSINLTHIIYIYPVGNFSRWLSCPFEVQCITILAWGIKSFIPPWVGNTPMGIRPSKPKSRYYGRPME